MDYQHYGSGQARIAQLILLVLFIPLISLLLYIILKKNFSFEGCAFLMIFTSIVILIIRIGFSYADIYITKTDIIVKKLFSTRYLPKSELQQVNNALLPFTFCVNFKHRTKIFFFSINSELFKKLEIATREKG